MKLEMRADGAHICGYVNIPEKKSSPVYTKAHGRVIETIEPGAFQRAIDRAQNIWLAVDHGPEAYASTKAGTLTLHEDGVGLYADALIAEPFLVQSARRGEIRGWSFGFTVIRDTLERQSGSPYPMRRVADMNLDHVSLIIHQYPVYPATSWELRDGCTRQESSRYMDVNAGYRRRLEAIKKQ